MRVYKGLQVMPKPRQVRNKLDRVSGRCAQNLLEFRLRGFDVP
jgi:hypothetical protein